MLKINPRFLAIILSLLGLLAITQNQAHAFNGVSNNVFKFQMKMAQSGKVQSQYKLGRMYETGRGTEQNLDEAMRWYNEASKNGFAPADDRITYYEVKSIGYSSEQYGGWVDAVIDKAEKRVPESMELLAQMYTEGVGVRRDDRNALRLLQKLSMDGNSEVDADIAVLESRLAKAAAKRKIVLKRAPATAGGKTTGKLAATGASSAAVSGSIASKVEAELVAKKKRYEAVMRQLREEQKMLEQQQAWAESDN